jgi:hypothetical protein
VLWEERDQSVEDDLYFVRAILRTQASLLMIVMGCDGAEERNAHGISNEKDILPQRSKPPIETVKLPEDPSPTPVNEPVTATLSKWASGSTQIMKGPLNCAMKSLLDQFGRDSRPREWCSTSDALCLGLDMDASFSARANDGCDTDVRQKCVDFWNEK